MSPVTPFTRDGHTDVAKDYGDPESYLPPGEKVSRCVTMAVIGGGPGGKACAIVAAKAIIGAAAGSNVRLYEARKQDPERAGRVYTDVHGYEHGAMWNHRPLDKNVLQGKPDPVAQLIDASGASSYKCPKDDGRVFVVNGQFLSKLQKPQWLGTENRSIARSRKMARDIEAGRMDDVDASQAVKAGDPFAKAVAIRLGRLDVGMDEGVSAYDAGKQHHEGEGMMCRPGMGKVFGSMGAGLEIDYEKPITEFRRVGDAGVILTTADGEKIFARVVVNTAPNGVHLANAFKYDPEPPPQAFFDALSKLPMVNWAKVFLKLKPGSIRPDMYNTMIEHEHELDQSGFRPQFLVGPDGKQIIICLEGDKYAAALESMGHFGATNEMVRQLRFLPGGNAIADAVIDGVVTGWSGDKYALGAFSAALVGGSSGRLRGRDLDIWDGLIFLAGEAWWHPALATQLGGAMLSGRYAARLALASLDRRGL